MFIVQSSFFVLQVTSVFEGLHEGRILCTAAADNNILLTGGESTVKLSEKFWIPHVLFFKLFTIIGCVCVEDPVFGA